jgi:multidrug efflux pump
MDLSTLSIRRPVLTIVFSIVIILFGIIGFNYLGVREYPSVDKPIVTITTSYIGANADVIESQITEPLEEAVNGIEGIRSVNSVSRDGRSTITVEFGIEIDMEAAANDVRDKVAQAVSRLPQDALPPQVNKADADATPIIFLTIKSNKRSLLELSYIAETEFKERLQTIPGVSEIRIWGEKRYAMRLWMDPAKLASYQLTPQDIFETLKRENVELPSGFVEGDNTELTVRTLGRLETPEDFENMIIKTEGDQKIRFKDVGRAELGPENLRTVLKRDGIPMVGNAIIPRPNSNHIEIADEFYHRLEQIKKDLPEDIELGIGFDTTNYIRSSIAEVQQTIFIAFFLVIAIIFLFLRDLRTTIIPIIAIPISLIGAFFVMYIFDFSINVLTLLGIVLAIGLVVDDAIIMMENIYSKIEVGNNPIEAGKLGANEIFFAVIATTVALVAVFMPVIFLEGISGRLFREFGIVLAGAVIISSFVALTMTPMLSSRILKRKDSPNLFYRKTEPFFRKLTDLYKSSLNRFMQVRWVSFVVIAVCGILVYQVGKLLPSELAPLEDRDGLTMFITGHEGATFEYMDNFMNELVQLVSIETPEATGVISVTSPGFRAASGVNSGFLRLPIVPQKDRDRSQHEIAVNLQNKVRTLPGARTFVVEQQTIGDRLSSYPVQYVIQAQNLEKLKEVLPEFMQKARESDYFAMTDLDLKFTKPEIEIDINREKANNLGVSVANVAQTLQYALSGQLFDYFIMNGKQYQVIGQLERNNRNEPIDIRSLFVRNNNGEMIQLDNIIESKEKSTPPQLFRYNRYVSATVSASLVEGNTVGDGIDEMDRIASEVLDSSFNTALSGASKDFKESSSSLAFAFILAFVLVYLVLAAQFESFRDPFVIMITVPLAMLGAVVTLHFFGQTLNIFSQIGMIMLIGLVTKNGILIVEFANQRKASGLSVKEAILDASVARFRPILMTTLSTILGTLPIALALGAGSESRVSMGLAIIGGLIVGSLLTLYVIPAFYSYISQKSGYEEKT